MKEVELKFKDGGLIEGQLTKGFSEDTEAEDVLRNIMKGTFKQKTAHRPHHHQPQKKKVVQGIGIR